MIRRDKTHHGQPDANANLLEWQDQPKIGSAIQSLILDTGSGWIMAAWHTLSNMERRPQGHYWWD